MNSINEVLKKSVTSVINDKATINVTNVNKDSKYKKADTYQINTEQGELAYKMSIELEDGYSFPFYLEVCNKIGVVYARALFDEVKADVSEKGKSRFPIRNSGAWFVWKFKRAYPKIVIGSNI